MIFSWFSVLRKLYVAFQFLVAKKVFILFSHYWTWELLIFFASLTLWPLSYCSLTYESAWVPIKLLCIISIVMCGEIVVCLSHVKWNELHPIICKKIFVYQILKATYNTPPNFRELFKENWKTSLLQTKFRCGNFDINLLKSSRDV